MRGKDKGICACIRCMLFIGMTVQILMGILWMAGNITAVQKFAESENSVIYPILLKGVQGIGKLLPVPYYTFMYVVQLVAAFLSGGKLLCALGVIRRSTAESRSKKIWYNLALVTLPMLMQCHLALLPDSPALSAWLMFLAELIGAVEAAGNTVESIKGKNLGINLGKACAWWIVAVLFLPEYIWYGAAVIIAFVLIYAGKFMCGKLLTWLLVPVLVTVCLLAGQRAFTGRTYGEITARTMVSRFSWPYFSQHFPAWSQEVWDAVGPRDAVAIDEYAENVENAYFPVMEEFFGKKQAVRYYRELAELTFAIHTKEIVFRVSWDMFCCSAPPLGMELQLEGAGYESYTGRNYDIMMQNTPELTVWYVRYSNWWFVVSVALQTVYSVLPWAGSISQRSRSRRSGINQGNISLNSSISRRVAKGRAVGWFMLAGAAVMVIIAALSGAGVMDYKKVIYVTLLWYLWILQGKGGGEDEICR